MKVLCAAGTLIVALATIGCGHRTPPPETAPSPPEADDRQPGAEAPPPAAGVTGRPARLHTIESGDTLWSLSRRYGVSVDALVRANQLADPDRLTIGDPLIIPGPADPAAAGGGAAASGWVWPVAGGEVISGFGARRGRETHRGLDIRASPGQPVLAARSGTVVYAGGDMSDYGNAVILDHGNGLTSLYGHNQELLVREGDRVSRGQMIARAGKTGNATTVHVHFEVRRYTQALDPLRFLGAGH